MKVIVPPTNQSRTVYHTDTTCHKVAEMNDPKEVELRGPITRLKECSYCKDTPHTHIETNCPECGQALEDGECSFCADLEAILADNPQAGNIVEFAQRV